MCSRTQGLFLVGVQREGRIACAALGQRQGLEQAFAQLALDQVARQPGEAQAAADERRSGGQAADRPALFGAEPADIAWLGAAGIADHYLHLALQVLESQFALQAMQGVVGVGDGDEFDAA